VPNSEIVDLANSIETLPWREALSVAGIILGLVFWLAGKNRLELKGYWRPALELLDAALIIAGVVGLGWPFGPLLFFGMSLLLAILYSLQLALRYDDLLAHAAAVSGIEKPMLKSLVSSLQQDHRVFRPLGTLGTARIVKFLGARARAVHEIESMAPPIAMLWIRDRPEQEKFVEDFDRLMRLWNKPARDAMQVADTVAATSRVSPMNNQEVIKALILVAE